MGADSNIPLHLCFAAYSKAFDWFSQMQLLQGIECTDLPWHLVRILNRLYGDQHTIFRAKSEEIGFPLVDA